MVGLRHRRFHGSVTYRYFDGQVTNILTEKNDKPETLEVPTGADLDAAVNDVLRG